jgi:hypothetical protein
MFNICFAFHREVAVSGPHSDRKLPSAEAATVRLWRSVLLQPSRQFRGCFGILAVPLGCEDTPNLAPVAAFPRRHQSAELREVESRTPSDVERLTDRLTPVCVALPVAPDRNIVVI